MGRAIEVWSAPSDHRHSRRVCIGVFHGEEVAIQVSLPSICTLWVAKRFRAGASRRRLRAYRSGKLGRADPVGEERVMFSVVATESPSPRRWGRDEANQSIRCL